MGTHFGEAFFLVLYGSIPAIIAFVWFWHINEIYKASTGARQVFGEWIFWWIARIVGFVVHIGGVAAVLNYIALHDWDTYRDSPIIWAEVVLGSAILVSLIPEYLDIRHYYRDDKVL